MRVILFLMFAASVFAKPDSANFFIFATVGQSQMEGNAAVLSTDSVYFNNLWMFDISGSWVPAVPPIGEQSPLNNGAGYSLKWAFLKRMAQHYPNKHIGIVPGARGSTWIHHWQKDHIATGPPRVPLGTNLYDSLVVRYALQADSGIPMGILMIHGTGDADSSSDPGRAQTTYRDSLSRFVDSVRADLGANTRLWLCGPPAALNAGRWVYRDTIRNQMSMYASENANTWYLTGDTEGLTLDADSVHLNHESDDSLGVRFANLVASVLQEKQQIGGNKSGYNYIGYYGPTPDITTTPIKYNWPLDGWFDRNGVSISIGDSSDALTVSSDIDYCNFSDGGQGLQFLHTASYSVAPCSTSLLYGVGIDTGFCRVYTRVQHIQVGAALQQIIRISDVASNNRLQIQVTGTDIRQNFEGNNNNIQKDFTPSFSQADTVDIIMFWYKMSADSVKIGMFINGTMDAASRFSAVPWAANMEYISLGSTQTGSAPYSGVIGNVQIGSFVGLGWTVAQCSTWCIDTYNGYRSIRDNIATSDTLYIGSE